MRLFNACLFSLAAHFFLLIAPAWFDRISAQSMTKPAIALSSEKLSSLSAAPLLLQTRIRPHPEASHRTFVEEGLSQPPQTSQSPQVPEKITHIQSRPNPHPIRQPRKLRGLALSHAQAALSKHLFYPPLAIEQGLEGEAILLLNLNEKGQVISLDLAKSSGHALLDEAALNAARKIGTFPGNPQQSLLPVTFRLQ